MDDNKEQIVLEVDDSPALRAIGRTNQAMEGMEGKAKTVIDNVGRKWTVYGDVVVRVSDKSRNSIDRLVSSMQKQAEMAGKSGVERLIAQRDALIKRYQGEQRAVDAITASYKRLIEVENQAANGGNRHVALQKLGLGLKDVYEGRMNYAAVEGGKFLANLGSGAMVVGGVTAGVVALGFASLESMKHLAAFGLEMENLHLRTGIDIKDLEQFKFAAESVGQSVDVYTRLMRGLSEAADENSKQGDKARRTLEKFGVGLRDVTGEMRPTADILKDISVKLNALPPGMERNAAAMALFKRAGVEAIPAITGLADNLEKAKEAGLGVSEEEVRRWEQYHQNITRASAVWERLKRSIESPLAATIAIVFTSGGRTLSLNDLRQMGVGTGPYGATGAETDAAARAAGFNTPDWRRNQMSNNAVDFLNRYQARQNADKAIQSFQEGQGIEFKLSQARESLSKLAPLQKGVSSLQEVEDRRKAEALVRSLEDQKKAATAAQEAEKKLQAFESDIAAKDMDPDVVAIVKRMGLTPGAEALVLLQLRDSPVTKMFDKAKQLVKEGANSGRAYGAAARGAGELLSKQESDEAKKQQKMVDDVYRSFGKDTFQSMPELRSTADDITAGLKRANETAIGNLRQTAASKAEGFLDSAGMMANQAQKIVALSNTDSTPSGELRVLQQQMDIRRQMYNLEFSVKSAHQDIYDIDRVRYELGKQALQDEYEMEEKILQIKHQQYETVKATTEGLVTTLLTKPGSFMGQLGSTIKQAALKPIVSGIAGMASRAITPIIYGNDGQGGINGALSSLFGGGSGSSDPIKVSTDANTMITAQNTAAVGRLTAAMSGYGMGGGGSIAGGIASAAGIATVGSGGGGGGGDFGVGGGGFGGGGGLATFGSDVGGFTGGGGASSVPSFGSGGRGFSGFGGLLKNLKGSWNSLREYVGMGAGGQDLGNGVGINDVMRNGTFGQKLTAVGRSPAAGQAGMMLAMNGLFGSRAGTLGGTLEGAAGGAMVGFQYGGPIGAAVGAGVGLAIGLGEMIAGVESPEREAKRLAKTLYGVNIDNNLAKQIAGVAKERYTGHVSMAVRDPDVRKMIMLYAQATGQKMPLSATQAQSASLAEQNGKLYQQATFMDGKPYTFQSNLPVAGGYSSQHIPSPSSIVLNVNGRSAADLLDGRIASTVNPGYVQDQWSSAASYSNGRLDNSAMMQEPGLITG